MRKPTRFTLALALALPQLAMGTPEPLDSDPQPAQQQWRMPLSNVRISSFFGTLRGRRAHAGIDFSIPNGTPVMATDSGTVVASTNRYEGDRKYGNVVVIEHDNKLRSLYAHLSMRNVNVGDAVTAGETIGLSGSTGRSTGPHLHLEAFRDTSRIDPNGLLQANLADHALPSAMHARRLGAKKIGAAKAGGKSRGRDRGKGRGKARASKSSQSMA